ncbi:hypothetical protein PIN31115_02087 [Pandoraea iniqua]|uniref:Uncharacterized protein n=1 Tax=Pandoraea iniqua TaxID=2508288 RepID=A0A5E4UMB6_9BURK|nr:hypothetical protein [Pandoraea iniqua]VVE00673.1 hypothetical protein PIN31115_02087 [Pandoraea iniqua]
MSNCLSVIQDICQRINLPTPSTAAQSSDPQITQINALAAKEGEWQVSEYDWQALLLEATFVTVGVETQVANITATFPGFKAILNDVMWNRDLRRPVFGPMTPQRWEQLKAMVMQGPWNQFQIRGNAILFIPVPAVGQNIWFQYKSTCWAQSATGAPQTRFLLDTDTLLLDEATFKLGIEWRWKKAKGLDYAQDFVDYEAMLATSKARDGSKDVINMGDVKYDIYPGILVPSGSWA